MIRDDDTNGMLSYTHTHKTIPNNNAITQQNTEVQISQCIAQMEEIEYWSLRQMVMAQYSWGSDSYWMVQASKDDPLCCACCKIKYIYFQTQMGGKKSRNYRIEDSMSGQLLYSYKMQVQFKCLHHTYPLSFACISGGIKEKHALLFQCKVWVHKKHLLGVGTKFFSSQVRHLAVIQGTDHKMTDHDHTKVLSGFIISQEMVTSRIYYNLAGQ